jgi:hypothetical protein
MNYFIALILTLSSLAKAELFQAIPSVSVLRHEVKSLASYEKEAALNSTFNHSQQLKRVQSALLLGMKHTANVNRERNVRVRELKTSILNKVLPYFDSVVQASELFSVSASSIVGAILTENAVGTNNKDRLQELTGALTTFAEKAISDDNVPRSYTKYVSKMKMCDSGKLKKCRSCATLPFSERFTCYSEAIGVPKFPGIGRTYGPAQISLESALQVADRDGVFDKGATKGVLGPMPDSFESLFMGLQSLIQRMDAAIFLVAATHRLSIDYYASKGWDISNNVPVLATLFNMGRIASHAERAEPPGGTYYPGTNFFGAYTYLIEASGLIDDVVNMGRELERIEEQGLDRILFIETALTLRTNPLVEAKAF